MRLNAPPKLPVGQPGSGHRKMRRGLCRSEGQGKRSETTGPDHRLSAPGPQTTVTDTRRWYVTHGVDTVRYTRADTRCRAVSSGATGLP